MRTERFLPRPGGVPAVPRAEDSRMTVNRAFVVGALFLALSLAPATAFRVEARPADAATQRALVDRYCVGCHNDRITSGNLRLDDADLSTRRGVWRAVGKGRAKAPGRADAAARPTAPRAGGV